MKRREFIGMLGGAAAWPLGAQAQQRERMRRIGLLMNLAADDPESMARIGAFLHGLHQLGWVDGRGTARLTCCNGETVIAPTARITSGASATNSCADLRIRSLSPAPQR